MLRLGPRRRSFASPASILKLCVKRLRERESAQLAHDEAWRQGIRNKYGSEPVVRYFETPLVIDNALGEVISPSA